MHKFVPWSRLGFFRNEHTRSNHVDPKLLFCCVAYHFGAFDNVLILHGTRCKMGWTCAINAQVCAMKLHRNFSLLTHPIPLIGISCIGAFCCIWVHFGLFRYCAKLDTKSAEMVDLMYKFVAWSRIGIFRNERIRSTPLDPKLKYCCVHTVWVHFGFVLLLHETRCKTGGIGAINAKFRATNSHRIFLQWIHPIHPIGP